MKNTLNPFWKINDTETLKRIVEFGIVYGTLSMKEINMIAERLQEIEAGADETRFLVISHPDGSGLWCECYGCEGDFPTYEAAVDWIEEQYSAAHPEPLTYVVSEVPAEEVNGIVGYDREKAADILIRYSGDRFDKEYFETLDF